MAYPADWQEWATGVLQGVGAQVSPGNLASLWSWSAAESGSEPMRWNNPLNTTQDAPGAVSQNSVGVKSYPSVQGGIQATVATLRNGRYGQIVADLVQGTPASQWQNACSQLETWGTGCGWLSGANATPGGQSSSSSGGAASGLGSIGSSIGHFGALATGSLRTAGSTIVSGGQVMVGVLLLAAGLLVLLLHTDAGRGAARAGRDAVRTAIALGPK